MLKKLMLCSVLLMTPATVALAQTPAHRAVGNMLGGQQAAPGAAANLAAGQFSTEQAAKTHCPGDTIVWANTGGSKAYHTSGDRYYGKTKRGAYMCQKEADQAGYHAAGARGRNTAAKATSTKATTK
jgi:hypothetical protein